jgi:hypothetical protein
MEEDHDLKQINEQAGQDLNELFNILVNKSKNIFAAEGHII